MTHVYPNPTHVYHYMNVTHAFGTSRARQACSGNDTYYRPILHFKMTFYHQIDMDQTFFVRQSQGLIESTSKDGI